MARYRYSPQQFLMIPTQFGRYDEAMWKAPPRSLPERAMYSAAYQQHFAACVVLRKALAKGKLIADLAEVFDTTPDTLRRKLHGEAPVRHDELTAWALAYGVDMLVAPADPTEMFPPENRQQSDDETV